MRTITATLVSVVLAIGAGAAAGGGTPHAGGGDPGKPHAAKSLHAGGGVPGRPAA